MLKKEDSLEARIESIERLFPERLDLITARTTAEFEEAFEKVLDKTIQHLEKNSINFSRLDENGLTAVVVGMLDCTEGLTATQESNSNGHVDLTIRADLCAPPRLKLGEAKIFRGYGWHEKGIEQLVQRYLTGREEHGLLLVYVKKDDIKGRMEKIRAELDKKLPCNLLGSCENHSGKWSFLTTHKHSSGEEIMVWHVGVNLYNPISKTGKKTGKKTKNGSPNDS